MLSEHLCLHLVLAAGSYVFFAKGGRLFSCILEELAWEKRGDCIRA